METYGVSREQLAMVSVLMSRQARFPSQHMPFFRNKFKFIRELPFRRPVDTLRH